ncbi:hypothetical protein [Antarctobacter heliothermus]|nr:hypothetical protein [Antarctobacter heliothermus]
MSTKSRDKAVRDAKVLAARGPLDKLIEHPADIELLIPVKQAMLDGFLFERAPKHVVANQSAAKAPKRDRRLRFRCPVKAPVVMVKRIRPLSPL